MNKPQWEIEFDEIFAQIRDVHRGECVICDTTGTKFQAHSDENGKVISIGGLDSIKDFIRSEIEKSVEETKRKCVEAVKDLHGEYPMDYNDAVKDATKIIKNIK